MKVKFVPVFLLSLFSIHTLAATAVVDAVQMPAWIEHGDRAEPLQPGQAVRDGDRVRTGQGARAYIKLPEGSTVKLGEGALLTYQAAAEQESIFKAALNVAVGAFRFTTAVARKLQKRDVAIQVGTATIGIRGTDVWGRASKSGDLVMLIEGHVEVQPAQGEVVQLTQSMEEFTAPTGGGAYPMGKANWDQFKSRARETEIWPGDGAMRSGGKVKLLLGTYAEEQRALDVYDRARAAGFAAKIRPVESGGIEGKYRYEVALVGLSSIADAKIVTEALNRVAGIEVQGKSSTPAN